MKKIIAIIVSALLVLSLAVGCGSTQDPETPEIQYTKYQAQFFNSFDTIIQIIGYTETEEEFDRYAQLAE